MTTSPDVAPAGARADDRPIVLGHAIFALHDPHRGHEVAFNRFYERDHQFVALFAPWTMGTQRWVATRALKDLRVGARDASNTPFDLPIDRGSFLTTFFIQDGKLEEQQRWVADYSTDLEADGRTFQDRDVMTATTYDLVGEQRRDDDGVPAELVAQHPFDGPRLDHRRTRPGAVVGRGAGAAAGDARRRTGRVSRSRRRSRSHRSPSCPGGRRLRRRCPASVTGWSSPTTSTPHPKTAGTGWRASATRSTRPGSPARCWSRRSSPRSPAPTATATSSDDERRARPLSHRDPRCGARGPARSPRPHTPPRGRAGRRLVAGHPARVRRGDPRLLGRRVRLAGDRGAPQPAPPVPHRDRRARHPLRPRAVAARGRAAARPDPRMAGLDRRVRQGDRAARRPGRPRR